MYATLAVGVALWLQYRGAWKEEAARQAAQVAAATLLLELDHPAAARAPSLLNGADPLVAIPAHQHLIDMAGQGAPLDVVGTTPADLGPATLAQCPPPPAATCCIVVAPSSNSPSSPSSASSPSSPSSAPPRGSAAPVPLTRLVLWIAIDDHDRPMLVGYCRLSTES